MIYYFLVEKVYIIRTINTPRMKSKLWLFNFFGVICKSDRHVCISVPNIMSRSLRDPGYSKLCIVSSLPSKIEDQQADVLIAVSHTSTREESVSLA
jgi:hypothetical protein